MAQNTVELEIVKSGYIRELYPTDVFPTDAESEYEISRTYPTSTKAYRNCLCFGFAQIPDALKYYELDDISLPLYFNGVSSALGAVMNDFDPATLTYANRQQNSSPGIKLVNWYSGSGWSERYSTFTSIDSAADKSRTAAALLQTRAFLAYRSSSYGDTATLAKIELPGGVAPKVIVTYDDAKVILSKVALVSGPSGMHINATMPITVTWDIVRDDTEVYYCAAKSFEQQSATFYWRESGEVAWNAITPQTASDKSVTIPAGTFISSRPDSLKSYEYYIEATDIFGHTSATGVVSFTTNYTQMYAMGTFDHYHNLVPVPEYDGDGQSPFYYYWNPHEPITFYWATVGLEDGYSGQYAVLYGSGYTTIAWKSGENGEEQEIHVPTFGAIQYSVPAETFPSVQDLYYQIRGTDATGADSTPEIWIRFATKADVIGTVAITPVNTVEPVNQPITFEWVYTSPSAAIPVRYELVWREYGSAGWNVLHSSTDGATSYVASANTFPVGQIEWAVFAYNIDNIAGTSVSTSFIAYGAPPSPSVSATAVPFTTISWMSDGQQAYEIIVDDKVYGSYFGIEQSFEVPEYLEDGTHTISVRVMGTYNLWSDYGSTTITVENVEGDPIEILGVAGIDAELLLQTNDEKNYYVYRDGVLIGRTKNDTFTDRFALGEHTYYVINKLPSGYYSLSESLTLEMKTENTYVADLDGGEWIDIRYTENSNSFPTFQRSNISAYFHLSGSTFPTAIVGKYQDRMLSMNTSFTEGQEEERKKFVDLFGKAVVLKFSDGTVFVGVIDTWGFDRNQPFYASYSLTARQIEWGDFVDDTDG